MSKVIIAYIDGTTQDEKDKYVSNIYKMYRGSINRKGVQEVLYLRGVGNEVENKGLSWVFGSAFGAGANKKSTEVMEWISDRYVKGDKVIIIGFSRGAAIARIAAGKLPYVTFEGCFDTVGAFGLPGGVFKLFQKVNLFHDMHVGKHVEYALHLVSLDETRVAFIPTLMNARTGIKEEWLLGVHSDIGGGEPHSEISDIALSRMVQEASKHGFLPRKKFLKSLHPSALGTIHYNDTLLRSEPREACIQRDGKLTEEPAVLHPSVMKRVGSFKGKYWPQALPAKTK